MTERSWGFKSPLAHFGLRDRVVTVAQRVSGGPDAAHGDGSVDAATAAPAPDEAELLRQRLEVAERAASDLRFLRALPRGHVVRALEHLDDSRSQLRQDLFVLVALGLRRDGFFVDVGAAHPSRLSNTVLLERSFGWNGVLAEPARIWHERIRAERRAPLDTRCVWSSSGARMTFRETRTAALSTLDHLAGEDMHARSREDGTTYEVVTVTLADLLDEHGAPDRIDYLSIDTEGSEPDILGAFDFRTRRFSVITCEHNHTPRRGEVQDLLTSNGYVRVLADVSRFDDWYVDASLADPFR